MLLPTHIQYNRRKSENEIAAQLSSKNSYFYPIFACVIIMDLKKD
ncbi:MAG: hypothetical protein KatS3mg027_1324 [Bacteroidia bacterium]|nr:MAG: hypothetical protein KatS3mg027_1324 [Bacteroidia bacterium]